MLGCLSLTRILLYAFVLLSDSTRASSQRRAPFRQIHAPVNPLVRLLDYSGAAESRAIRHDDTFLLRFNVLDDPNRISVLLRPSHTLIHPDGVKVSVISQDGTSTSIVQKEQVRSYEGVVIAEPFVERYWAEEVTKVVRPHWDDRLRGHASISLREDDAWEGSMFLDGDIVHFKPLHAYLRDRSPLDPQQLPMPALVRRGLFGGGTVLLREADAMSTDETVLSNANLTSCSHDRLTPNQIQAEIDAMAIDGYTNPSFDRPLFPSFKLPWHLSSPSEAFIRRSFAGQPAPLRHLMPRQDIIGGNTTNSFAGSIGSTTGCPKEQKVVYIGVAVDCTAVTSFGSPDEARISALNYVNSVSTLYAKTFNVSIGVVELQVMNETCPTSSTSEPWNVPCSSTSSNGVDLNTRLSLFSQWRSDKGGGDGAGLWHLLTACQSGSEVGVAWLSALCRVSASSSQGQTTSGTAVTALTDRTWQVMAHEIGHNFGAIHDCDTGCSSSSNTQSGSPCCPLTTSSCDANSAFVMSPVSSRNVSDFSQCSVGNICTTIQSSLNTSCLVDPGQRSTLSINQCGNGILDPGEECDPGSEGSSCCDSSCKLTSGSVCDPANFACCTSQCAYAPSTLVCRPSVNAQCDPQETCSGTSASCPADKTAEDGTSCGSSGQGLYCAAGQCTSRDQQCRNEGSFMNLTRACSSAVDSGCRLTCAEPGSSNQCIILDSTFADGTECGLAGRCRNGSCQNGSFSNTVSAWVSRNPQIAYPVFVVGGLVILLILFCLIRGCWRRSQRNRQPSSAQYLAAQNKRNNRRSGAARPASYVPPPPMAAANNFRPPAAAYNNSQRSSFQTPGDSQAQLVPQSNSPRRSMPPSHVQQPQQAYQQNYAPPSYAPPLPPGSRSSWQPPSGPQYQDRPLSNPFTDTERRFSNSPVRQMSDEEYAQNLHRQLNGNNDRY